jgi:hypothetical protein
MPCAEMCGHHLQDGGVGDVTRGAEEAGGRTRLPPRHQGDQPSQTEARGHRKYKLYSYLGGHNEMSSILAVQQRPRM